MERDLRHAMDLESPFVSPALPRRRLAEVSAPTVGDIDDVGNDGDDEVSLEEDLSFPFSPEDCSQMAKILGLGLLSPKSLEVQGAAAASMSASRSEFFLKRNDNIDVDLSASGDIFFGRHQEDDIFQDIFELGGAELNLPPWLLPTSSSKPIFSDDVSMSFASLPTLLKVEAATDDEEDARQAGADEKLGLKIFGVFPCDAFCLFNITWPQTRPGPDLSSC